MTEKIAAVATLLEKALDEQKKGEHNYSAAKRFRKHLRDASAIIDQMRKESLEWKK